MKCPTKSDENCIDFQTGTVAVAHSANSSEISGTLDPARDWLAKTQRKVMKNTLIFTPEQWQ